MTDPDRRVVFVVPADWASLGLSAGLPGREPTLSYDAVLVPYQVLSITTTPSGRAPVLCRTCMIYWTG